MYNRSFCGCVNLGVLSVKECAQGVVVAANWLLKSNTKEEWISVFYVEIEIEVKVGRATALMVLHMRPMKMSCKANELHKTIY